MCRTWGSNSGPLACQAGTLPIELPRLIMYVVCMYMYVYMCVCVCVKISSLKPLGQLKPGYVYNDYTSRTPECVTDMIHELGGKV